jgi:hypothetical protein
MVSSRSLVDRANRSSFHTLRSRHFNVLGRYHFTVTDSILKGEMRPLRNPAAPHEVEDFIDEN